MRATAPVARIAALSAVAAAAVLVAVLLLRGMDADYRVKANFQNAAQLVKGNLVQVSGIRAGSVEDIALTPDGQAQVTLKISDDYAPLRRGTQATVRQASLSGVANRYVDLHMGPQRGEEIPDGGVIEQDSTTTAVDLDQIFNTFDDGTREDLSKLLKRLGRQHDGRGKQMNAGLLYLNPSLSASSRLFRELNRDSALLERFVVASSQLVTDLADRREDVSGLVDNLATTTTAIGNEQTALRDSIQQLPDFMRRANTTFLNLRAALDDLDPLVEDSKPVAKKLRPFLAELRPLARDARPTLRDLSRTIRRPGAANDLIELNRLQPALRDIAARDVERNGKERRGAFPASADALRNSTELFSFFRPYSADLVGWFDDFSHSGTYDALGAASRVGVHANAFALLDGQLSPLPPELREAALVAAPERGQDNRCPGAGEHPADDGSNPYKPSPDFNCDETQLLPGG